MQETELLGDGSYFPFSDRQRESLCFEMKLSVQSVPGESFNNVSTSACWM